MNSYFLCWCSERTNPSNWPGAAWSRSWGQRDRKWEWESILCHQKYIYTQLQSSSFLQLHNHCVRYRNVHCTVWINTIQYALSHSYLDSLHYFEIQLEQIYMQQRINI